MRWAEPETMTVDPLKLDPASSLRPCVGRARSRARARDLAFDVDIDHLMFLWQEQKGCCAVSGLPFSYETKATAFVKTPFAPSLDRIDPSQGYIRGNVRLVCTIANFALNQWGDDVVRRFAHGVIDTERREKRAWFRAQRRKLKNAEKAAEAMSGADLAKQRRVIAGLKRSITMGPARLGGAAITAHRRIRSQG